MINVAHGPALVRAEIRSAEDRRAGLRKATGSVSRGRVAEARAFGCLTPRVAKSIGSNSWQPSIPAHPEALQPTS